MSENHDKRELFPDLDADGALRAAFQDRERAGGTASRAVPPVSAGRNSKHHDYELRGEIARGGMGVIVKALDRELDRDVALKVLRDELAVEPHLVRRFFEEARVNARLDHPGIVPVYEVGRDLEGRAFFAMRLVRGRELKRIIELAHANAEGWNLTRALSVIQKVCEAMAYVHGKGVLHRDLKPSNVMVGEFGEVYVMDWGLARTIGSEDAHDLRLRDEPDVSGAPRASSTSTGIESPIVTMDGEVLGTPCYMAPEQAQGRIAELGPRSDVYSVGAMLYHLLAGEMPYVPAGSSVASRMVLLHLVKGPPRPLQELRPEVPPELAALCEKAMSREPRDRYPDMLAMAEDLRAFLERRVVRAYETGPWAEAKKWMQRNKSLAAALAVALVALVVGLLVSLSLKARSDANFVRAERSAQSAIDERDRALKIASFLEATLSGVSTSVALGRDTTMLREMMDAAWSRIEKGELAAAPEAEMRLMLVIGAAFHDIAQYDKAEPILRRVLERARQLYVGDNEQLADVQSRLGLLLRDRGDFAGAEPLLLEALAMRKRVFPGDHKQNAGSLENLAALLQSRGDLAGAEARYGEALLMRRRLASGDDDALAVNLGNLGVVLQARGDLARAEPLFREAIEMQERLSPGDHPHRATQLNNLGALLGARGDLAGAERLHRLALDMRRRLFPADHPELAASINNLATVLFMRGDLTAAEPLMREALVMQTHLFKGDHPMVARAMANLSTLLSARGDLDGAEQLLRDSLSMQKRMFDGDRASIAMTLCNLGQVLRDRADLAGAEALLREAFEMERRLFPGDHADVARIESNLALVMQSQGDLEGAEPLSRDSLEMQKRLFPGDHPDVARNMVNLAVLLRGRGDLNGSEALLREALRMFRSIQPTSESSVATVQVDLGLVLTREKRFSEANDELLAAAATFARDNRAGPLWNKACLERIVANYSAWNEAEPGRGILDRAAEWQQKLIALENH